MEVAFTSKVPPSFTNGGSLSLVAKAKDDDAWLAITFLEGNDILTSRHEFPDSRAAFQVQLRLNEKIVVMNNCVGGSWSHEERHELAVDADEKIKVRIRCDDDCFEVFINAEHFASFKHREDPGIISYFNVYGEGNFEVSKVKIN